MERFKGKIAFVMGAASKRGMGHAIAVRLAKEGADVIVADKYEAPKSLYSGDEQWKGLKGVVEEIESVGRKAIGIKADVSVSTDVNRAVQTALSHFGKIDIMINCAAIVPTNSEQYVVVMDEDEWEHVLAVNVTGSMLIAKAVAKHMLDRNAAGSKILFISSISGKKGTAGGAAYGVSKFGVIGLTQVLALELAPYKINVNAICPGSIMTNIQDERFKLRAKSMSISMDEYRAQRFSEMAARIPLGRMGTADDVANLALFLVSSHADYMTGQSINFTGGLWMT